MSLPTCFGGSCLSFYLFFFFLALLDTSWLCFVWMILTSCGPHLTYNIPLYLQIYTSMYSWLWVGTKKMPRHLTYHQVHPFRIFNLDIEDCQPSISIFHIDDRKEWETSPKRRKSKVVIHLIHPNQVSRLMLRPNRAYSATFSCCISSRSSPSESSSLETSASIFSVDVESIPCASDSGSWKNESPIL